jgi:RNA polymerase sigma-54 factor
MEIQLGQSQSLKQSQRLIMSPRMQQAINLLQLPVQELSAMLQQEIAKNPIFEMCEETPQHSQDEDFAGDWEEESQEENHEEFKELYLDGKDFYTLSQIDTEYYDNSGEYELTASNNNPDDEATRLFRYNSLTISDSIFQQLMHQARLVFCHPWEVKAAEIILGSLDHNGFFEEDLEELSILYELPVEVFEAVLQRIHLFDPPGIAARSIQEGLLIQLRAAKKQSSLAYQIIDRFYYEMTHNQIPTISKALGASVKEIVRIIQEEIAPLNLRPNFNAQKENSSYIVPDGRISVTHGKVCVWLNEESLPEIRVNNQYLTAYYDPQSTDEFRSYLKEHLSSGKWLLRNLMQRNETLRRILELIAKKQMKHFLNPETELIPLTMKALAGELELHESTIARAVANKYIDTPSGIVPLRSFFTNSYSTESGEDISALSVKGVIAELIRNENPKIPLSDDRISQLLQEKGITCARRTISKYRRELNIVSAAQRKRY